MEQVRAHTSVKNDGSSAGIAAARGGNRAEIERKSRMKRFKMVRLNVLDGP